MKDDPVYDMESGMEHDGPPVRALNNAVWEKARKETD